VFYRHSEIVGLQQVQKICPNSEIRAERDGSGCSAGRFNPASPTSNDCCSVSAKSTGNNYITIGHDVIFHTIAGYNFEPCTIVNDTVEREGNI
jgi:hypothetical protein